MKKAFNRIPILILLLILGITLTTSISASSRKYKNTRLYVDEAAWYVGSWHGTNMAFDPPLDVEITILPSGEFYAYSHGRGRSFKVSTHGKVINIKRLPDTPMRGKMKDASTMIIEDGGIMQIKQEQGGLQTTVEDFGIVVRYQKVTDPDFLVEIQQRVVNQAAKEPHHKDNDFWHSPEFWGGVLAGAVVGATTHHDHVTIENSGISKSDVKTLQKYYK